MSGYNLGLLRPSNADEGLPAGFSVRFPGDLRKIIVFVGHADDQPGKGGINCIGTAFFVAYEGAGYLVTAGHVARDLRDDPFLIRVNTTNGKSKLLNADQITWVHHPDENVDVAAIPYEFDGTTYDCGYCRSQIFVDETQLDELAIGVGDFCYAMGLFQLLAGQRRNLPVVHTGHIALLPSDEKIPVNDGGVGRNVSGYLVELQNLKGLSGSPVFVRPTRSFVGTLHGTNTKEELSVPVHEPLLLGLWRSSWDAPPGQVLAADRQAPEGVRVPVGMGIVEPASRIMDVLKLPELTAARDRRRRQKAEQQPLASPDAAPTTKDENPQHKEDFTRLLNAAVRTPRRDEKT